MLTDVSAINIEDAAQSYARVSLCVLIESVGVALSDEEVDGLSRRALDQLSFPQLFTYAASGGEAGAEAVCRSLLSQLEAFWRDRLAVALAAEFAASELSPASYIECADSLLQAARSIWPSGEPWPEPSAVAQRFAAEGPFSVRNDNRETTYWCKGGKLHRDPLAGPAYYASANGHVRSEYWFEGKLHRPSHLGPAISDVDSNSIILELAFLEEDRYSRDPSIGPAIIRRNANGDYLEAYVVEGLYHRPSSLGAAVVTRQGDSERLMEIFYCEHGVQHRPAEEGPAVILLDCNGDVVSSVYWTDGEPHRHPAEGPAAFGLADGARWEAYWVRGQHFETKDAAMAFATQPACDQPGMKSSNALS